jgi:hypothetical protein
LHVAEARRAEAAHDQHGEGQPVPGRKRHHDQGHHEQGRASSEGEAPIEAQKPGGQERAAQKGTQRFAGS